MGTLLGFAAGYLVGTSVGQEGRDQAVRAAMAILGSEQVRDLGEQARTVLLGVARQLGTGAAGDIGSMLRQRISPGQRPAHLSRVA